MGKTLDERIERLESLNIVLSTEFKDFSAHTNRATGANAVSAVSGEPFLLNAEKNLAKMEDAIKRYHEDELQKFEEK